MRVFFAALFVMAGVTLPVVLFSDRLEHASPAWNAAFVVGEALLFFVLCAAALVLFDAPFGRPADLITPEQYVADLEAQGLLVVTDFQAVRAFQVEEYEDEGLHYFVELADGVVLYLNGQDLYDYEPIEDDPEFSRPRRFPCTEFTLRTHRMGKFVVDVQCRGEVFEPEFVAAQAEAPWKWEPECGEILTGQTYDEIKRRFIEAGNGT